MQQQTKEEITMLELTITVVNTDVDSHCVTNNLNFDVVYGDDCDSALQKSIKQLKKTEGISAVKEDDVSIDKHGKTVVKYSYKKTTKLETENERNRKEETWASC